MIGEMICGAPVETYASEIEEQWPICPGINGTDEIANPLLN